MLDEEESDVYVRSGAPAEHATRQASEEKLTLRHRSASCMRALA